MEISKETFDSLLIECEKELITEKDILIKNEIKRCLKSIHQQENSAQMAKAELFEHIKKRMSAHDFGRNDF